MYPRHIRKQKRRHILQLDYDDDSSSRSTPSPTRGLSSHTNGNDSISPPPIKAPVTKMDDEFANFMAEIDAIEDVPPPPPQPPPPHDPEPPAPEDEEFSMAEPVCNWQQCLDETTQCYYYWHMETNVVSWEIPTEFTQHLLLYKEYEEALCAFNARKEAREALKKTITDTQSVSEAVAQLPPPPPPPSKPEPAKECESSAEVEREPEEVKLEAVTEQGRNFLWFMRDHEREEKERQEEKKRAYAQKFVKGGTLEEEKKDIPEELPKKDVDSEDFFKNISHRTAAMLKGKGKSKFLERIGAYDNGSTDSRSQSPTVIENEEEHEKEDEDDDNDDEDEEMDLLMELQKKQAELIALEMEVGSPPTGPITPEQEPETDSVPELPDVPLPPSPELPPLPPEPDDEPAPKKIRNDSDGDRPSEDAVNAPIKPDTVKDFVPREGSLAETRDQAQIEELSSLLTGKLECMQITRETMSKMQILLIEIQTRIVDWVAGALDTKHLLNKLREASQHVKDCETISAPPGWTCHYDREYKQYYYINNESGDSQWEYPVTKADLPLEFGKKAETPTAKPTVLEPEAPGTPSPPPPPKHRSPSPIPPPPADPQPPPGVESHASRFLPPPPPPPGLEPPSPENVDMELDDEESVVIPELLPPPVPPALRPKVHPPPPQFYPMGYYPPRPFAPVMGGYAYHDHGFMPYPAPRAPPAPPAPPQSQPHVSAAPVLFKPAALAEQPSAQVHIGHAPKTGAHCAEPLPDSTTAVVASGPTTTVATATPLTTAPSGAFSRHLAETGNNASSKKKKKEKIKMKDTLSLKRKNVSGLVQKWQQAQQQVTQEVARQVSDDDG